VHDWRQFKSEPLANLVKLFNRYNRKQLLIKDEAIQDKRVSGYFDIKDVDSFMAALDSLHLRDVSQQASPAGEKQILLAGRDCQWNGVQCTNQ
jgi:ferric-dicitrate binding protein FerR (iron transport regulator)